MGMVDINKGLAAPSPRKPSVPMHASESRFHDSAMTKVTVTASTGAGLAAGISDIDGIRKDKEDKIPTGTSKTLTCTSGAIVGFEKIQRYDVPGKARLCGFHQGQPSHVERITVQGPKTESECANKVRNDMLSASGVTWNSVTKDCSANLQEPDGITDTAGMIACQFILILRRYTHRCAHVHRYVHAQVCTLVYTLVYTAHQYTSQYMYQYTCRQA